MGILFARRDFLSAFISCFMPIILVYYPLMLFGMNMGKEGIILPPEFVWTGNVVLWLAAFLWALAAGLEALSVDAGTRWAPGDLPGEGRALPSWGGERTMWILDRERYWSFVKAYFICFVALVGLYVVIDSFSNLDEFEEVSPTTLALFGNMGRYYLIKMSLIYDQICGIITMMAAIFTVTWMQRNNELLAMLAAGISTQRVIRPVLVSALADQQPGGREPGAGSCPRYAEQLQRPPDDDGSLLLIKVYPRQDGNDVFAPGLRRRPGQDRSVSSVCTPRSRSGWPAN